MHNDRFHIMGVNGGDILLSDPCQNFANTDAMAEGMASGLRDSLARSPQEWGLGESLKSASREIELKALAHWMSEPRVKIKRQIVQVLGPNFDHGGGPESPALGMRGMAFS